MQARSVSSVTLKKIRSTLHKTCLTKSVSQTCVLACSSAFLMQATSLNPLRLRQQAWKAHASIVWQVDSHSYSRLRLGLTLCLRLSRDGPAGVFSRWVAGIAGMLWRVPAALLPCLVCEISQSTALLLGMLRQTSWLFCNVGYIN